MKCITHDCSNCSDEGVGRAICVEPDDDGWICEPCWQFLTNENICQNKGKIATLLRALKYAVYRLEREEVRHFGKLLQDSYVPKAQAIIKEFED